MGPNPLYLATPFAFNPPWWRGFLHYIIVSDISPKQEALGYISVAESFRKFTSSLLLRSARLKLPNSLK